MDDDDEVALLDFTNPDATDFWHQRISLILDSFPEMPEAMQVNETALSFLEHRYHTFNHLQGITLRENSPYVRELPDYSGCDLSNLKYIPTDVRRTLDFNTVCPGAMHAGGKKHLEVHNEYALGQVSQSVIA